MNLRFAQTIGLAEVEEGAEEKEGEDEQDVSAADDATTGVYVCVCVCVFLFFAVFFFAFFLCSVSFFVLCFFFADCLCCVSTAGLLVRRSSLAVACHVIHTCYSYSSKL
jgi:hypothetical protein